jgi:putative ATPase
VPQQNLPDALKDKRYYIPSDQGHEKKIGARLKEWWKGEKPAREMQDPPFSR